MHSLKFRRRIYQEPTTDSQMIGEETIMTAAELKETSIAALQILSIGVLSGLCCFTGTLLMTAIIQ